MASYFALCLTVRGRKRLSCQRGGVAYEHAVAIACGVAQRLWFREEGWGAKNCELSDDFFEEHTPGRPVVPQSLQGPWNVPKLKKVSKVPKIEKKW